MKLTKSKLKEIIKEEIRNINEVSLPSYAKGLQLKKVSSKRSKGEDKWDPDVLISKYIIKDKSGKKVGELETDDYFGYATGELFGKHLADISGWTKKRGKKQGKVYDVLGNLHSFLKSKSADKLFGKNGEKIK
jgi:hypothetical protein